MPTSKAVRKNANNKPGAFLLRRAFRLGYEHDPQLVFRLPVVKALKEDNVREGFLEPDKYRAILEALTDDIKPVFVVAIISGWDRRVACAEADLGGFAGRPDSCERPRN